MTALLSTALAPEIAETVPPEHRLDSRVLRGERYAEDEFFGHQPTPRASLPDPRPLIENLTRCVVEILAGARELDQISRWVTDEVHRHLLKPKCQVGNPRLPRGGWPGALWNPSTPQHPQPSSIEKKVLAERSICTGRGTDLIRLRKTATSNAVSM